MSNAPEKFHLFKLPSPKVRHYRRAFYGLHRKFEEPIEKWLKRIESRINRCDYTEFSEYLIIDRFFSELNTEEIAVIQSDRKTWSLKQLHQYLWTENVHTEPSGCEKEVDDNVRDETDPLMGNQPIDIVMEIELPLKQELVSILEIKFHFFVDLFDFICQTPFYRKIQNIPKVMQRVKLMMMTAKPIQILQMTIKKNRMHVQSVISVLPYFAILSNI